MRVVARGGEPDEIAQRPLAERQARARVAKLRAPALEQHAAIHDLARMHDRQAAPQVFLVGGEPFEARVPAA